MSWERPEDEREPKDDLQEPVARFFADERSTVREQPGDEVHWQSLVRESRTSHRRWPAFVAGAAAAAVVIAAVGFVLHGSADHRVSQAGRSSASQSASRTASGPTTGRTGTTSAGPSRPQPVPRTFHVTSVSNSGRGRLYALGSSLCGASACPVAISSADNGATWVTISSFPGVVPSELTGVRFANPSVGWVFGSTIRRTTDGGHTWAGFPYTGGGTVLSLETDGSTVWMATAGGCLDGRCDGELRVLRADVNDPAASTVVTTQPATGLSGAEITVDHGVAYLNRAQPGAPLVLGSSVQPLHGIPGCAADAEQWVLPTANTSGTVFGVCRLRVEGSAARYAVVRSRDGGQSWVQRGQRLLLPAAAKPAFAARGNNDLVAVAGEAGHGGSVRVSHDGGSSWSAPLQPPAAQPSGFSWVGSPGADTYYLLSPDSRSYWLSTDRGDRWAEVTLRRS